MRNQFVEYIPENLEEHVLYISLQFETAIHRCACGCMNRVVTPLSEFDWKLIYEGDKVSLEPSILNRFKCKSHYHITKNEVVWC